MESGYWHDKWATGNIAFHREEANPALVAHLDRLALPPGARLFVPLCGKTRDIGWLRARGYRVCGAELSETAVARLFAEMGVEPERRAGGPPTHYAAPGIDIHVGDILALDRATLGPVDAVYDRAALVALPEGMRARYAAHLVALTGGAPQLLVCYDYDQAQMDGPPFSVDAAQVRGFYAGDYDPVLLARGPVPGGLKGRCAAQEDVWLLQGRKER